MNALIQELMMSSCQYFTNNFKGNIHSASTINRPNIINVSLQESENVSWISTSATNKWNYTNTYTISKWIIMTSSAERRNKGKAPAQDYSQDKKISTRQPFVMHEGASSGVKLSGSTSLQEFVPAEVTYSSGDMVIALQEVLSRSLQFHNGNYSELLDFIKFIFDNLQVAFIKNHHYLFLKTLLEIHLVNLTAQNEVYTSHYANLVSDNEVFESHLVNQPNITNEPYDPYTIQLFGKKEIHSMDKMTIMGTDYAKLSLKTQSLLRSVVTNLPIDIQFRILRSKAMSRSFDLWFEYFKVLVTTAIPDPTNSDDISDILEQADWEDHFGSNLRVYERKHPFPSLLVNYDDGSKVANNYDNGLDSNDADRGPNWLSQMFEYGFIKLIK